MMKKQTFENYQDYLNSEKWKQVKEDFNANYSSSGWGNVCEVTGEVFEDKSQLHHHHFKYPKDWNEDSPENIVLISKKLHNMIHNIEIEDKWTGNAIDKIPHNPKEEDLGNRRRYLSYLRNWNILILSEIYNSLEKIHFEIQDEMIKLRKEKEVLPKRYEDEVTKLKVINEFLMSEILKKR